MTSGRYREYINAPGWLHAIPSSWRHAPMWAVATCNDEVLAESSNRDQMIRYVEISGVTAGKGITEVTDVSFGEAPSRARRKVRDGDVLVSTVRTYLRAIAPVKSPPDNMIASTGFAVLRPKHINADYLGYVVQAQYFISEVIARSVGVSYPAINASDLMNISVPCPSASEQTAIAIFLDRETSKIDALMEEQKRLIELLKEKRQAVISHAVTKGLDPNARMKPSGVGWLGDVPAHWELLPLKRLGIFEAGAGFPDDEQGVEGEELPFFKVNALGKADAGILVLPEDTVSKETAGRLRAFVFPAGTIVFAKIGAALLLGRLRFTPRAACLDNNLMGYMVYAGHSSAFVLHAMSLIKFDLLANPGTVPSLNKSQIEGVIIAVPPHEEQVAIADHLREQVAAIEALIRVSDAAMKLLAERRSALISAAVTGKIDVRDFASQGEAA